MVDELSFDPDIKPKNFFEELVPQIFNSVVQTIQMNDMESTELSVQVNLTGDDGGTWSLIIQDGKNLQVLTESYDKAKVEVTMTVSDWREALLTGSGSMDMMAVISDPDKRMDRMQYDSLTRAKGRIEMELSKDDGSVLPYTVVFNKQEQPELKVMMPMQDYIDINTGKANPQQMFMQGKIKFRGDMNLAMTVASIMPR